MEKQTAVEWLVEQLETKYNINIERLSVTDKAKGMFEQQIKDAYKFGIADEYVIGSEKYYNQTYNQ
jgi:hypothetical protein